ncbi:uncharacterized protein LOC124259509 [Haliotis rubra]|uniref:uncharacterized protein LOC124259509 n=1 Tax=Haliotis rubra TaxID=36100 RepID=UPI001EE4FE47|nr:uncharacterized protein LOC124259509 [Haliotis rubra]
MSIMFRLRLGRIEIMYICCLILWNMILLTNTCMPDLQYGKRLLGSTFKIIENSALFVCAAECASYGICKSFHFELGLRLCHLNGFDDLQYLEGGGKAADFIYSSTVNWNKTTLGPCQKRSCGIRRKCTMKKNGTVKCEEFLPNIAKDKPASASSVWSDARFQPGFAVDGDGKTGSCFVGNSGDFSPWWQVDLQDTYVVVEVRVTNREEFRPERLHDFSIDVYQDDPVGNPSVTPQLCYMYNGAVTEPGKTVALRCTSRVTGRYMRLSGKKTINGDDLLQFCEVQVFGFKPLQ